MVYVILLALWALAIKGWWNACDQISILELKLQESQRETAEAKNSGSYNASLRNQEIKHQKREISELKQEIIMIKENYTKKKEGERVPLYDLLSLKPKTKEVT